MRRSHPALRAKLLVVSAFIILAVAFAIPAGAQNQFHSTQLQATSSGPLVSVLDTAMPPPTVPHMSLVAAGPLLTADRTEETRGSEGPLSGAVRISQTPFVQQISMPLARIWGGHVQVKGFASFDSMENLLWGLPASGNLPARSVTTQSHVGVWAPSQEQSFGLTLTLHRGGQGTFGYALRPGEWICRVFRRGRG